jgi:hypothetical protein
MRLIRRSALYVFALIGAATILCHYVNARETTISREIDESTAQRLAAEAFFGADKDLEFLDYDGSISRNFTPPFIVFDGLSKPPAEGSFGVFAVNPWTGDVWNLWGCHRLSTPALRKSQAAIRRRFTPAEMKQYARLRRLKPECTVED